MNHERQHTTLKLCLYNATLRRIDARIINVQCLTYVWTYNPWIYGTDVAGWITNISIVIVVFPPCHRDEKHSALSSALWTHQMTQTGNRSFYARIDALSFRVQPVDKPIILYSLAMDWLVGIMHKHSIVRQSDISLCTKSSQMLFDFWLRHISTPFRHNVYLCSSRDMYDPFYCNSRRLDSEINRDASRMTIVCTTHKRGDKLNDLVLIVN